MSLLDIPAYIADLTSDQANGIIGAKWGVDESSVRRHKKKLMGAEGHVAPASGIPAGESAKHNPDGSSDYVKFSTEPWGHDDYCEFIRATGQDPAQVTFTWGWTSAPNGGFWNKLNNVRPIGLDADGPAWPVIQPAKAVKVKPAPVKEIAPGIAGFKLALKCADHQIGFRALPDGTYDPFHDVKSMALFVQVCGIYQPDKIQILGDFLDLPSQSRWAQEATFARTTQMALDTAHRWLAELRATCPLADIVIIEGNHDKRMQNFMETNALAAFGLRRADMPDSWPVMSIPNLLRLDDLNVRYIDAYPAATDWDNATTRNIHGTKSNSKGSTTSQYIHELPHISSWVGHTHRAEITYHRGIGQFGEAIESYSANPGVMCRTDGATPSVHGAIGADGIPVQIVENWQNGLGFNYYNDTESWPQVYRILNGRVIIGDRILSIA